MEFENSVPNEEIEKAYAINSLVDRGFLTRETASNTTAEEIDRLAQNFKDLQREPEVTVKETKFEQKNGYPSDECFVISRQKEETIVFRVRILEHFQGDSILKNRLEKIRNDSRSENQAINYRPGLEKAFEAEITEQHDLAVEEVMAEAKKHKASFIEVELPEGGGYIAALKAVNKIAQGYHGGFEKYQREKIQEAVEAKEFAIDLMRKNKSLDAKEAATNIQALVIKAAGEHGLHYVATINNLVFALEGGLASKVDLHDSFKYLISTFGPKDSLRQSEIYKNLLRDEAGFPKGIQPEIPEGILLQGCRMAEVGGNYIAEFESCGAEAVYQERHYSYGEFGGIKQDETQITLDNYEKLYPGLFDITMSREVMDPNSGVETGFSSSLEGSKNLLAAFANMTRKGGISIHQGGAVPADEKYLSILGFEHIFTIQHHGQDPICIFLKVDDTKVSRQDILQASSVQNKE